MNKHSLLLFGGALLAQEGLLSRHMGGPEAFIIRNPPDIDRLKPRDFLNAALSTRKERHRPSGKDRSKVKAARRQNHRRRG